VSEKVRSPLPLGARIAATALVSAAVLGIPAAIRVAYGLTPPLETGVQLAYTVVSITGVAVALEAAFWWRLGHGGTPWRSFAESLLVATLVLVPAYLLSYALLPWVPALEEPGAPRDPVYYVVTAMGDAIPVMLVVAAVFLYPRALERAAVREAEVAALRREAEILRLRASLEPHFVLNTLNTIAGLVGESPGEARSLLGALGDLFRDAVTNGDVSHPLSHEVAWLERYAALLRARYDGQVDLAFEIAPEARAWRVPRLVLQPPGRERRRARRAGARRRNLRHGEGARRGRPARARGARSGAGLPHADPQRCARDEDRGAPRRARGRRSAARDGA
jgi:hypothetical protein